MKSTLRVIAIAEAISFLVLLAASAVKRTGGTDVGVQVLGAVHGGLFVLYVILAISLAVEERWKIGRLLLTLLCSVLPFGGFVADRKLIAPPAAA